MSANVRLQFPNGDPLHPVERCCRSLTRTKEIADAQSGCDDNTFTTIFNKATIIEAYRATCTLASLITRISVHQRMKEDPAIITERWPAIRYWFIYITMHYRHDDYNIAEIPMAHHQMSPAAAVCKLLTGLLSAWMGPIKTRILCDARTMELVARLWLEQNTNLRLGHAKGGSPSSQDEVTRRTVKWVNEFSVHPSSALGAMIQGETKDVSSRNVRILLNQVGNNCRNIAAAAIQRLRNILRVYRRLEALTNASAGTVKPRSEDLRLYIYLIGAFLSTPNDSEDVITEAFLHCKLAATMSKALKQLVALYSSFYSRNVNSPELDELELFMGTTIQVLTNVLIKTGSTFAQEVVHSSFLETIATMLPATKDQVQKRAIKQRVRTSAEEQARFLMMGLLPRFFHFRGLTKIVFKSIVTEEILAGFLQPADSHINSPMKMFACLIIERAVCAAMYQRRKLNARRRCGNVRCDQ